MYIIAIGVLAVIMFAVGTLMLKNAERRLVLNRKELASTLRDYVILLKIYRNILKERNRVEGDIYDDKLDAYDALIRYQKVIPE
jgi:hypothetical protein